MHVFQTLKNLVNDVLLVDVFEDISSDDGMQVSVHEIEDEVNVAVIFRANYILESDDIFMAGKLLEEDNFSESTLCVSRVLECIEVLLEGDNLLGAFINGFPDDTVRSLACKITTVMQVE